MVQSLRFRLSAIFICLAVVPLLVTGILLTWYSVAYLEKQSQNVLHETALRVGTEIKAFVEDHKNTLFRIHKLYGFELLGIEKQRTILNNLMFDQHDYQDLVLLSSEGQEVIRASRSIVYLNKELMDRSTHEEFLFPATRKETYFSSVYFDTQNQEPLITIATPFFDLRSGKLASVLVAKLRFKKIWNLLADIEIPGEGLVYVVDQAGKVIAHPNPSIVLSGTRLNRPQVPGRARGLSGTDVIISWDFLPLGAKRMAIVAEQPISQAFKLIWNILRISVSITFIVLVLAIAAIVLAIRRIVRPVEFLAGSALAISNGDYTQHIEVIHQDEIGTLTSAFNKMSQDLAKYRSKMEELVKVRTDELAEANMQLRQEIVDRIALGEERKRLIDELQLSLENVKILSGLLPICSTCKKIRDDQGYWNQIESYIRDHSEAKFSHGLCPECAKKMYPELYETAFPNNNK